MTDDEQIAGWIDGALPPEAAARFEARLASDPELARQVAAWQRNDDLLRGAFDAPMAQEVDNALLARMGLAAAAPAPAAQSASVIDLPNRQAKAAAANDNPARWRWALPLGGALAAGLALAVILTGPPPLLGTGGNADTMFAEAMERLPSRGEQALPDGSRVSPVLSFAAADGRFCREFSIIGGAKLGGGIACKGSSGWKVEARSAAAAATVDPEQITMAAGPDGSALDAAYARLGASDPLSIDAERQLIASGWKSRP